jgi:hypothetical protein
MSAGDPVFEAWLAEARAMPLEAGLLGRLVHWLGGGRGIERCGPCPACGGQDRFSMNVAKGVWHCRRDAMNNAHGGNDAISLAMHIAAVGFVEAVEMLVGERPGREAHPSSARAKPETLRLEGERNLDSVRRIVSALRPIVGTPAEHYLADIRRIDTMAIRDELERTDAIGWNPGVYFHQPDVAEPGHELHGHRLGCIVGIMTDAIAGRSTGAISRTYISNSSCKVTKAKTLGKPRGVVRLSRDEDVHRGLFLAEGLETALSGIAIGLRPMWAVGDANMMAAFPVLAGIDCLTLIADHDANGAGEAAAREAATRWRNAGREGRIFRRRALGDLNDAIMRGRHG